jgi:hypothetical protein
VLIEAYPGSERISNVNSALPLHCACANNSVATVEYLHKLFPDAINHAARFGYHPIHAAIKYMKHRDNPAAAVDILEFLLDCDTSVRSQTSGGGSSLLRFACLLEYNDSNIEAALGVIKIIYDTHPEQIENEEIPSHIHHYHKQVQGFINSQLVFSHQAKDHRLMTTPDEKGHLPLHRALQNNVRLGSIKLLGEEKVWS